MLEQKQAGLPLEIVKSSPQFHSVTARGANGKEATFSWAQRDAVLNLIEATKSGLPISSHELAYTLHQKVDDFSLYTTHNVLGTVNKRLAKLGTEIVGDYNPAEGTLRFLLEILNEEKRVLTKQAVLRNRRRRIFWKKPGNTEEENLQIGIQNIQTLFLERFPEFNQLFPKDKDGRIPKDKHKQAKDFIIKNIGTWEKFHEGVSYTAGSTSSPPYFKGSLDLILRSSFSSWGIDFDELSEEPKDAVLDQEEGLAHLGGFLERKYPFSHLRPFVLELSRQRTSPSGQMHFYISRLSSTGNSLRLSLTPKALFSSKIPEVLYINPQSEDKKGEKPYYWIDVLTDPDLSSISRVVSMRLQPDEPRKKIDSMRWRTIEEQLAVDFILGENGITYEHLRPFVFTLNARTPIV